MVSGLMDSAFLRTQTIMTLNCCLIEFLSSSGLFCVDLAYSFLIIVSCEFYEVFLDVENINTISALVVIKMTDTGP